jgi:membrane protease YdiL (CAAX protease family)
MMFAMNPKAVLAFCLVVAGLAAGTALLSAVNSVERVSNPLLWVMVSRFGLVAVFAVFGMYAAQESGLRGSVVLTSEERRVAFQNVLNYGILPGVILGLINYLFFFINRYSPLIAPRIRTMDDLYDVFLISIDASLFEEIVYRLFIMSCLFYLFRHLYRQIRHVRPTLVSLIPKAMALVVSSLLFAVAHNVNGFTGAFVGGLLLGSIFLSSGIESAVAAHFVANFLFFTVSYLV